MGTSVYPGALDDFAEASPPYLADDDTTGRDHPARHDDLEAAMEAVQGELGTDPSGGSATVKARLDAADATVASKAPLDSPAFTGTVNFTGTSVIGLPVAGLSASPPSSVANSGGTASLSGNTVTFTGVSSVSLNGCFTGDYDNYVFRSSFVCSDSLDMYLRMRASGSDTTSGYNWQRIVGFDTTAAATRSASATTWSIGAAGTGKTLYVVDIMDAFASTTTGFISNFVRSEGAVPSGAGLYGGAQTGSTSFDGFTIYPASGTITGTISVYGYKS